MRNTLIISPAFLGSCKSTESGFQFVRYISTGTAGMSASTHHIGNICPREESGQPGLHYIC